MEIVGALTLGVLGALALWGLYRALEFNWPDQYVSLNDTFALKLNLTWWRLFLYRFLPVFGASVAVWATSSRLGFNPVIAVVAMLAIHALNTNVRAAIHAFGLCRSRADFQVNYAAYHLLTLGVVFVAGCIAMLLGEPLTFLVPRPSVLLESLWIAVFIAIASGLAVAIIGKRPDGAPPFDASYYVWRAERDVGIELIDLAFEKSIEHRCDPILLRTIMFTEVLQRPRWVRRLERLKGRIFARGSYGVTQEKSDRPISDAEAVSRTAARLSGKWAISVSGSDIVESSGLTWMHASSHNEDVKFIGTVQEIYSSILLGKGQIPYHNSMLVGMHIVEIRRYSHHFGLRGISAASSLRFTPTTSAGEKDAIALRRPEEVAKGEPWAFELRLDVDVSTLRVKAKGRAQTEIYLTDVSVVG